MAILIVPLMVFAYVFSGHMGHMKAGTGCERHNFDVHGQRARCVGPHDSVVFCDEYCKK